MKRLLTVIALGLLSSPAFAEEKTPEQLRDESNRIFGVEGVRKDQARRVVASGKSQRIGFFTSLNPDCSSSGDADIRVTKEPEHGKVDTSAAILYPSYPKENIRFKCNEHKVRGVKLNYTSAEKYVGDDTLDFTRSLITRWIRLGTSLRHERAFRPRSDFLLDGTQTFPPIPGGLFSPPALHHWPRGFRSSATQSESTAAG